MKIKQILGIVLLLGVAPVMSRAALFDAFLKIEGIEGESTDSAHRGEIEILSYSLGLSKAEEGGGVVSGKVQISDLQITKQFDKSTPKLMLACATGQHINQVLLTLRKGNARGGSEFLQITLENVQITSYQLGAHAGNAVPVDQFSLNFEKIKVQSPTGGAAEIDVGQAAAN